jgi:hypothetical protein
MAMQRDRRDQAVLARRAAMSSGAPLQAAATQVNKISWKGLPPRLVGFDKKLPPSWAAL